MEEIALKSDQSKAHGNDFRRRNRIPYSKMRKAKSEPKKQNVAALNTAATNKSVGTSFNNQKNYKGNRQKGISKDRGLRIRFQEVCSICEKQIKDILSCMSMKFNGEDKPIHFDCAIDKLKAENELVNNESLVYRGVGKFFVVDKSVRGNNLAFKIVKEIDFENLESRPIWRKKILQDMNKGFKFY
ncbi:hypothetical protein A0V01_00790 [Borrelia hermsii]|uniref:Uncharacterized protein n=3 Tax=Borrelia hermsii TaxID=140 RepID=A0AAN0X5B5_BORHE|nr:hypothetical protein BH0701 [Borrelia hermsii DAH]AMR75164.1 hypothetical protein A0V01_00790 [Borrelia hermsii]ANA43499.1 hypothetical protein AXX13_03530 [Borrelia hermsii HS1]